MMINENVLLAPYTTFKIGGPASFFCRVVDQFDALEGFEFARDRQLQTLVLGGGSNLLISDNGFKGLVMKVENKGIEILREDDRGVLLKVASGEVWDEVVRFAVTNGWWGIENLSHIPGSTGAIAVQNVGAYGQEAKHVIESVTVFDRQTGQIISLNNQACGFVYRTSIFNTSHKGRYIIFYINFILQKNGFPNLSYRDLQTRFNGMRPRLADIRQAVTEIRDIKFPFPTEAKKGNAGSFFKNPILSKPDFAKLKQKIAGSFNPDKADLLEQKKFKDADNLKVPAAFLLELCGLKDLEFGGAKINYNQPLVIINASGEATSADVLNLAASVLRTVKEKTGILLQIEPELVGFRKTELESALGVV
jgi:UDP-N-acetylmuramate dehydrogenase